MRKLIAAEGLDLSGVFEDEDDDADDRAYEGHPLAGDEKRAPPIPRSYPPPPARPVSLSEVRLVGAATHFVDVAASLVSSKAQASLPPSPLL